MMLAWAEAGMLGAAPIPALAFYRVGRRQMYPAVCALHHGLGACGRCAATLPAGRIGPAPDGLAREQAAHQQDREDDDDPE